MSDSATSNREENSEEGESMVVLNSLRAVHRKIPFKFKYTKRGGGKLLTVHHTKHAEGSDRIIRVRLSHSCFSFNLFLIIDKRGNAFTFDLEANHYWVMPLGLQRISIISSTNRRGQFLVGTKLGQILLLDVVKSQAIKELTVASNSPIKEISFPGQPLEPRQLALINVPFHKPLMVNLESFQATHRMDFDDHITLKFASFIPQSENIFTCFSNDYVHIWSGITLHCVNIVQPMKKRDRQLRLTGGEENVPAFSLGDDDGEASEFAIHCKGQDLANGCIQAYCYKADGSLLCLSTSDRYLLIFSAYTFHMEQMFRLRDFDIKQVLFLSHTKETLIWALTTVGHVCLLDCQGNVQMMIVQTSGALQMNISSDSRLLAVLEQNGEASIWSTAHLLNLLKSQEKCVQTLKDAFKQNKPITLGPANDAINSNIMQQLKRHRLLAILKEYGCYPLKYRTLIWCALLELPFNWAEFQLLLSMQPLPAVVQRVSLLKLKSEVLKRALVKVWSCLARWCKVLAHSDFLPHLICPFVTLFPRNTLIAFEICVTLVHNHFNLWFEFHPMEPANYLGICENILQYFDPELSKFYKTRQMKAGHFAWPLLMNGFSVVLSEDQWLQLWDNIVSAPPYYPIFVAVAYNVLQRENIIRLPSKECIMQFFGEQNPIDVCKLIAKAYKLQGQCPSNAHPKRFIKRFQNVPKKLYPKFLNYPVDRLNQHEVEVNALRNEHCSLDSRIRQLEVDECRMLERLEKELQDEEHHNRMKEMEIMYHTTLKREEERIACQRKMLLLYQKEIRQRKSKMLTSLIQCDRRKRGSQNQSDLDQLMHSIERERLRNDTNLLFAEEELRSKDFEVFALKYLDNTEGAHSLPQKYHAETRRLQSAQHALDKSFPKTSIVVLSPAANTEIGSIERKLDEIQKELRTIIHSS